MNLAGTGATFNVSGATGAQTIGALNGGAGTNVTLGTNALTLNGSGNGTFGGAIGGAGGVTFAGTGTQTRRARTPHGRHDHQRRQHAGARRGRQPRVDGA